MQNNIGITGILTNKGVFFPCHYGEHGKTINTLKDKSIDLSNAIIFSTGKYNNDSSSYVLKSNEEIPITKHQKMWYYSNKEELCEIQKLYMDYYSNQI